MNYLRRTWAEIDTTALIHNFNTIKSLTKAKIFSVVKANAYGHTVELVVPALDKAGTDYFAVSNLEEAKELRALGIQKPILVLGYTPPENADELIEYGICQTVFSYGYAEKLNEYAKKSDAFITVHLKLDTGMGRIGFDFRDDSFGGLEEVKRLHGCKNLVFEGVFTHFPVADTDKDYTVSQYNRFIKAVDLIKSCGFDFKIRHCCNSAAFLNYPEMHLDAVRPGIILYGLTPDKSMDISAKFKPVMTFNSVVSQVKEVSAGDSISYGRTHICNKNCKIATVTAGYADGIVRLLSNKGRVLINGKYAPVVGRICMDQFSIDVTDIDNVKEGDIVTLFGKGLSADEFAENADTINYEAVCGISARVPRISADK